MKLTQLFVRLDKVTEDISRIKHKFKSSSVSKNQFELQCRLDMLNSYIEKAMGLQSEIDSLDPENDNRSGLEEICVTTKALFMSALAPSGNKSQTQNARSCISHYSNLPKLKLPTFSGKHAEFKQFISLFESLVDSDNSISDIEKFNHLISCLPDEALGTVQAYQMSAANYPKALASLHRVYDNKCLIFFDTLAQLFDIPPVTKPSASALRSII
jgi:hypothetical protein